MIKIFTILSNQVLAWYVMENQVLLPKITLIGGSVDHKSSQKNGCKLGNLDKTSTYKSYADSQFWLLELITLLNPKKRPRSSIYIVDQWCTISGTSWFRFRFRFQENFKVWFRYILKSLIPVPIPIPAKIRLIPESIPILESESCITVVD